MSENPNSSASQSDSPSGITPLKRKSPKAAVTVKESKLPRAPGELPAWQAKTVAVVKACASGSASAYRSSIERAKSLRRNPSDHIPPTNVIQEGSAKTARKPFVSLRRNVKVVEEGGSAGVTSPFKALTQSTVSHVGGKVRFAQFPEDLGDLAKGATVVLFGEAVVCSLEPEREEGTIEQPPRLIVPFAKSLQSKGAYPTKLYVYIRSSMLRECAAKSLKITLAIDYFLQYGLKAKRNIILLAGGHGLPSDKTQVHVLGFKDGRLDRFAQLSIQPRSNRSLYPSSIAKTVENEFVRFDGVQGIHIFDPLLPADGYTPKPPVSSQVVTVPLTLFDVPVLRRINYGFRLSSPLDVLLPAGVLVGAGVACFGTLYLDQQKLASAQQSFKTVIGGHLTDYAQGQASLGKLALKKEYMTQVPPQVQGTKVLEGIIEGSLSGEGTFIRKIELRVAPFVPDPGNPEAVAPPNFKVSVVVPAKGDIAGLEQGQPILQSISKSTGAECTLVAQSTETVAGAQVRVFEIEGRLPQPAG